MSSLARPDFRTIEELVESICGRGHVLDVSDLTFSEFLEDELNADIDDVINAKNGGSKGKRLRTFLTKVDNASAIRTLQALWARRVDVLREPATAIR